MPLLSYFGFLLTLSIAAPSFAGTLVPEITPKSPGYTQIQNLVTQASNHSNRFLDISFRGISGSLCYSVDSTVSKNPLDTVLLLNGKYFLIPTKFTSPDNFHQFYFAHGSAGKPAGIYLLQTGFRVDLILDRPARAVATIRIADIDGNILPALEYEEMLSQAQTVDFLETHPRVTLSGYSMQTPRQLAPAPRDLNKPDYLVDETLPGDIDYAKTKQIIDWAEGYDQVYFLAFTFNGIKGRITAPSPGALPLNDALMRIDFNGKLFTIPFDFSYFDNWNTFTREVGKGIDGVYLTQRGFRRDANTKQLSRVVSKIRVADINGSVLSKLEYHEDVTPATLPASDILIERAF